MKYINAHAILPETLVKELQSYIQGGYIYIPVEEKRRKGWGEVSGYRQELGQRNQRIREAFVRGISIEFLSEQYGLSVYAIRKIVYCQAQPVFSKDQDLSQDRENK